jgi:hypothetical protein
MKLYFLVGALILSAVVPRTFADVPIIDQQTTSQTNVLGDSAFDLLCDASSNDDGSYRYQWWRNNVKIAGATGNTFTVDPSLASFSGTYFCVITNPGTTLPPSGAVTSAPIVLTIWYPPVITQQPTNILAIQGDDVFFTVQMSNLPPAGFTYQWENGGIGMYDGTEGYGSTNYGTTTATLTISNVQEFDSGDYEVDVFNATPFDTLSVSAILTVIVPPTIIDQPDSITDAIQGEDVFFAVGVDPSTTGNGNDPVDLAYPLSYQWRHNGINLTGQNDWFLDLPNPTPAHDNGTYDVVISNYGGSVTSIVAQLVVFAPPALAYQMINGAITDSGRFAYDAVHQVVLYANATGTTLAYQWYKGNDPINGATNATYSFYPTNISQSDAYSVYISNDVDSLFTDNLYITVVPEITAPTVSFYYSSRVTPADNARITNSPAVTLLGQGNDNTGVASVQVQQNGGPWSNASVTNYSGTHAVNWGINYTLVPGSNTFVCQSIDVYSNMSSPDTTHVFYFVPSPFTLLVSGPGSVATNWTGNLLEIGKNYTMTATPSNSFKFVGWSGGVSSTNPALTFMMQSNLVIQATFFETNPPTLAITNPASNSYFTNTGLINVQGTAADNAQLVAVRWQVNGGPWTAASGTTNWTAAVGPKNGTNVFRAYSVDGGNNYSPTNNLTFVYVALDKVTVLTNGQGTMDTNYAGQMLYLGQTYSITATANTNNGFVFTNWTSGIGAVLTNGPKLNFVMQSNLTVQANFKDIQNPTVTITNDLPAGTVSGGGYIVGGSATDNDQVVTVKYQLNSGGWQTAVGTNTWTAAVNLVAGTNIFQVYSTDAWGNKSAIDASISTINFLVPATIGLKYINSQPQISFPSFSGVTYNLEYKNALADSAWTTVSNFTPGTGGIVTLIDSNSPPAKRVYRLRETSP